MPEARSGSIAKRQKDIAGHELWDGIHFSLDGKKLLKYKDVSGQTTYLKKVVVTTEIVYFSIVTIDIGIDLTNDYGASAEFVLVDREVKGFDNSPTADMHVNAEYVKNYINEFCSYPHNYKGKKDWQMIHKMSDDREINYETGKCKIWQGRLNENGDFELTHQIEFW